MEEQEYEYHAVHSKPTEAEIETKRKDGWEPSNAPEGVIGRDLEKEPKYPHSLFYFGKRKL